MKLDWRQSTLYAIAIGTETCWLYAVLTLLNKWAADESLSVLGILVLFPSAFIFNMLLRRLAWPKAGIQSISWLAWAAGMLLILKVQLFPDLPLSDPAWLLSIPRSIADIIYVFKPELLILLTTIFLWWLGQRLAYRVINFPAMVTEFQLGLVMLVLAFFIAYQLEIDLINPVPLAFTFFLLALLGISMAHALEGTGWLSGLYQGHWSGLLLISIVVILLLGLLISTVITADLLQLFWTAIKWLWGLFMKAAEFLASLLPEPEPVEPPAPMPGMPGMEPGPESEGWTLPEMVRTGIRIGWSIMFSSFILFALWRLSSDIFRWLRQKLASMSGAEIETLPGAFRADILGLLKRILLRLTGWRLAFRRKAVTGPVFPEATTVRHIYRRLLSWAKASGYPRHVSQTPLEYFYALVGLLPESRGDLELITQGYVRTRYGASLLTEGELSQLSQAWHRLRQNRLKSLNR